MPEPQVCPLGHPLSCPICAKEERRKRLFATLAHGTLARYQRVSCRCPDCREAARVYMRDHRAALLADPSKMKHGTLTSYSAGCRCEKCKDKNQRYHKQRKKAKKEATNASS